MKRIVSVAATVEFHYEVDDEAVSDWDGAHILTALEERVAAGTAHGRSDGHGPIYTPEATQESLLGHLGLALVVDGRSMGNIDGWADFGPDAAKGWSFGANWTIDSVDVSDA